MIAENYRPWLYFYDSWNNLDFSLVLLSFLSSFNIISFDPIFLRLLRLFRVLKLLQSHRKLQLILDSLMKSMTSVLIITIMLFAYLLVYGSIGMALFGKNDAFHFGSLSMAVYTLFQCLSFDNWSGVMYVNLYGCEAYPYPGVVDWDRFCTLPLSLPIPIPIPIPIFL